MKMKGAMPQIGQAAVSKPPLKIAKIIFRVRGPCACRRVAVPLLFVFFFIVFQNICRRIFYIVKSALNFINYVMNCSGEQDACSVIGTPSVTGQGPRFTAQESISVAAKSGPQEGCKKFINYLLGGKFISKEELSISSICINKDAMKSEISLISQYNNEIYEYEMEYGLFNKSQLKTMGYKEATETMQQKFYDMLSTLSVYYMDDKEIKNIINEELAAYYSGDKPMDDVIRFINDRVTKYVNEAR